MDVSDILAINAAIFSPDQATDLCDTNDDQLCDVNDILGANAKIFGGDAYCARFPGPASSGGGCDVYLASAEAAEVCSSGPPDSCAIAVPNGGLASSETCGSICGGECFETFTQDGSPNICSPGFRVGSCSVSLASSNFICICRLPGP